MTQIIWVTLITFLVGLMHPQNKLSGCDLDITKTVLASGKWGNFGSDECTEISLVWNQLIISSYFEVCGVQRSHFQEVCARDQFCILPRTVELLHIKIFLCHVNYITLVTSGSYVGHIRIVLRVSGSYGSTGATHFQPCMFITLECCKMLP